MVGGLPAPNSIVAVAGHVYWSDQNAIGRIYWTQLGYGTIGRARLAGGRVDGRWLDIHSRTRARSRSPPT